jgi:hypothetical protein
MSGPDPPKEEQQEFLDNMNKGAYVWIEEYEQIIMRQQNIGLMLALLADEYLKEWAGVKKCYSVVAPLQFAHKWRSDLTDQELYAVEKASLLKDKRSDYAKNQMLLALARVELGRGDAPNVDAAKDLKDQGNVAFTASNFREAKRLYTRAIDVFKRIESEMEWKCFEPEQYTLWATCYSNRAECYLRLGEPNEAVCDVLEMLDLPRGPIPERIIDKAVDRLMRAREAVKTRPQRNKNKNAAAQPQQQQQQAGSSRSGANRPPPKRTDNKQKDSNTDVATDDDDAAKVLKNGADVANSDAYNKDECYLCMVAWGEVSEKVLLPACKHALCVKCVSTLRHICCAEREKEKRTLKQADCVQCGLCRAETVIHVDAQ